MVRGKQIDSSSYVTFSTERITLTHRLFVAKFITLGGVVCQIYSEQQVITKSDFDKVGIIEEAMKHMQIR